VGVGHDVQWDAPIFHATCLCDWEERNKLIEERRYMGLLSSKAFANMHPAPLRRCMCGVWAMKNKADMTEALRGYACGQIAQRVWAYGRVQLWGRIVEHKLGWRAEYARPLDVNVIDGDPTTCELLGSRYACDTRSVPSADAPVDIAAWRQRA